MILDARNEFADAVSVAAVAGTAVIGNQIDMQALGATPAGTGYQMDVGNGQPVYLVITTDTEIITGGTAGTIKFQLVSDSTAALAVDGSSTVHFDTGTFVTDDAAANSPQLNAGGVICCVALPLEGAVYERFLGILAIIGTTTVTAGKINAFLTLDPIGWKPAREGAN